MQRLAGVTSSLIKSKGKNRTIALPISRDPALHACTPIIQSIPFSITYLFRDSVPSNWSIPARSHFMSVSSNACLLKPKQTLFDILERCFNNLN